MVNLTIDGIRVSAAEGTTIMDAAQSIGINVPHLCFLKDINEIAACRVCVVEVEGNEKLITACNNVVKEGMIVHTNSPRVRRVRKTNVGLILSQHDSRCATCVRSGNCELQRLANNMGLFRNNFRQEFLTNEWDSTFPMIRQNARCIKCMRCIQVCDKIQTLSVWDVVNTGSRTNVGVSGSRDIRNSNCALCGQCVTHCPTGALRARDDIAEVLNAVHDPNLITVAQVAPAVRVAWGERFGLKPEVATEKRLATILRHVGIDYIFDTNFAADLTIMEEASEFLTRLTHPGDYPMPMFTSCCPGWLRFARTQYPELLDNLSTCKSPQQMFGAITKTYFAEKLGVDPSRIRCISFMPCMAKKDERTWEGMDVGGSGSDVDFVLTTRELARLIRSEGITPDVMPESEFDSPLGEYTGAGVIFGTTGGVMEAALRTAFKMVTGKNPGPDVFSEVRGMKPWKEASFNVNGIVVHTAVVSGLGNTRKLIEALKRGEVHYDFIEVMACPGGCVGGGGQPIHDGQDFAAVRAPKLYDLDRKKSIRFSHENPEIIKLYENYLGTPNSEKSHHLLHVDQHRY